MSDYEYFISAEWEEHEATWLVWPQNGSDWPGKFSTIKWVYAEIIKNLVDSEKVRILVNSGDIKLKATKVLSRAGVDLENVEFYHVRTDRSWIRDSGPFFVKNKSGEIKILNFKFNSWAKYKNWQSDNEVPVALSKILNFTCEKGLYENKHVVLEGGSIDVNSEKTLITSEQCLVNKNKQVRNESLGKSDYEKIFHKYLGIHQVIWLGNGITGDDTNGHIDDLCRFVNPGSVVVCMESDPLDDNYEALMENRERLEDTNLDIVEIPMPKAIFYDKYRLPASYLNFYISNKKVLVPTFNDPSDYVALGILKELFPGRDVVGINSTDLILGLGSLHCLTKEQPFSPVHNL